MADTIAPDEQLSRFVLDRNHFTSEHVKFRAFLPPKNQVVLSVSRTRHLEDAEIWALGDQHVASASRRTIQARADFGCAVLSEIKADEHCLAAVPDEPPPRHANVTGWPSIERKELQKVLAQQLAARTRLTVREVLSRRSI